MPFRPRWREVAERADLCAYALADIAEATGPAALCDEWRSDVPAGMVHNVRKMMDGRLGCSTTARTIEEYFLRMTDSERLPSCLLRARTR